MHKQCTTTTVCPFAIILLPPPAIAVHSLGHTTSLQSKTDVIAHTHTHAHKSACSAKIGCNCTHTYNVYIAQHQLARGRGAVNGSGFYIELRLLGSIISSFRKIHKKKTRMSVTILLTRLSLYFSYHRCCGTLIFPMVRIITKIVIFLSSYRSYSNNYDNMVFWVSNLIFKRTFRSRFK